MKRGTLIVGVIAGDYGKLRPMLVVQPEEFDVLDSVIVCPLTSDRTARAPFRVDVEPNVANGLHRPSTIMTDKISAIERARVRERLGHLTTEQMATVDERLALVLGLAG